MKNCFVLIQPRTIAQPFTFLPFYFFTFKLPFYFSTFKSTTHHRAAFYFFTFLLFYFFTFLPLSHPRTIAQPFTFLPFYFFTFNLRASVAPGSATRTTTTSAGRPLTVHTLAPAASTLLSSAPPAE